MKEQQSWAVTMRYAPVGPRPGNRRHPSPDDFIRRTVVGPAATSTIEAIFDLVGVPEKVRATIRSREVVRQFVEGKLVPDHPYPHHAGGGHYVSKEPEVQAEEWTIEFAFITQILGQQPGGAA